MVRKPILFDVKVKGVKRTIARTNRIIANLEQEADKTTADLARDVQRISRRIIRAETTGTGALADGIQVKKSQKKQGDNTVYKYTLGFNSAVARYAPFVHNGFKSHWVHKDMIAAWLAKHPQVKLKSGKWLEVGAPKQGTRKNGSPKTSAPWLNKGGVKFFDKAFAEVLRISEQEYTRRLKRAIGGK